MFIKQLTYSNKNALYFGASRFLDEYDTKVAAGPHKYKRAAEFLMNVPIAGLKNIVKDLIAAKETAVAKATAAESKSAQASILVILHTLMHLRKNVLYASALRIMKVLCWGSCGN